MEGGPRFFKRFTGFSRKYARTFVRFRRFAKDAPGFIKKHVLLVLRFLKELPAVHNEMMGDVKKAFKLPKLPPKSRRELRLEAAKERAIRAKRARAKRKKNTDVSRLVLASNP